jgi:hypothetical protein
MWYNFGVTIEPFSSSRVVPAPHVAPTGHDGAIHDYLPMTEGGYSRSETSTNGKNKKTRPMKTTLEIGILAALESCTGSISGDGENTKAVLTMEAIDGSTFEMDLDTFDAIYRGFVKCWPTVKPLKGELAKARSAARDTARDEEKEAKKAEKAGKAEERAAAKILRESEQAAKREERETTKLAREQEKATKAQDKLKKMQEQVAAAQAKLDEATTKAESTDEEPEVKPAKKNKKNK